MASRTLSLTDSLSDYIVAVSVRDTPILKRLREETLDHPMAVMQISPEQGQFMALLVEMLGARRTLEIGTFTGYSALVVAAALPADGRVITCDIDEKATAIARRYWAEAGLAEKIELRLGPAIATLDRLIADGQSGRFDFAFIDANKKEYAQYYERALTLLRPGGLAAIDNVLWSGKVADPAATDPETEAIRAFNANLAVDSRVSISLVPIGDGLTLARKRA
jgi:predicted O-methyltransferase YrrM